MKYTYYYQTSENENRSGVINARDRADAYTKLRKQGVRPYRVVGDDPVRWRPVAYVLLLVLLLATTVAALVYANSADRSDGPLARQQLAGDAAYIAREFAAGWTNSLPTRLDRLLAGYAQPGFETSGDETVDCSALAADLDVPLVISSEEPPETRQLKRILLALRIEARDALATGGTLTDYFETIRERQQEEVRFRARVIDAFLRTPVSLQSQQFISLNLRLKARNLAPIPVTLLDPDQRKLLEASVK